MAVILFDNGLRSHLQPFTLTRAVADLRFGIFSIRERWAKIATNEVFVHTAAFLQQLYEQAPPGEHTWIDASVIADSKLTDRIFTLAQGHCIADDDGLIAGRGIVPFDEFDANNSLDVFQVVHKQDMVKRLQHPWDIMLWNDEQLRKDFVLATGNRTSQALPASVTAVRPENIFVEAGATLRHCIINAETGPVYIGHNAEIMEGSVIRGPFVLGDHSVLKMNSRIYGATTLGPYCMGGGEIKNSVLMGYSNKAHDGYLGDSVVGEWCNFGAGSSNSNIKNTAGMVKVWSMGENAYVDAGQKCGVIMGDYSRAAINSSINTGSMVGVCCNVFGEGLLPTLVDNFSWGVNKTTYEFEKAIRDINNWKKLKGREISASEISVLQHIFDQKNKKA